MAEHEATPAVRGAVSTTNIGGGYVEVVQQNISHYAKFLIPLITAGIITFQQLYGQGSWVFIVLSIVVALAQVVATYGFSQGSSIGTSLKFWANVAGAVAQAVIALIGAGGSLADVDPVGWSTVGLALLTAIGVGVIPNGLQVTQHVIQTGAPDPVTGENIVTPLAPSDPS